VEDVDDMIYAPPIDPVWYPLNGKIYVKPDPTSAYTASISAVSYPTVDASADSSTTGFPDGLEARIVDFMVIKAKQREAGVSRRDAQTEIEAITDSGILTSLATTYTNIGTALDAANVELDKVPAIIDLANTEYDLINPDVDTASTSVSTNKDPELGIVELQIADRRATTGNAYVTEAQARIANADGYIKEAGGRNSKAQAYLQESGIRLQNAQTYLAQSQQAQAEAKALQEQYIQDIQFYVANHGI
jgi:hypothetical protein